MISRKKFKRFIPACRKACPANMLQRKENNPYSFILILGAKFPAPGSWLLAPGSWLLALIYNI